MNLLIQPYPVDFTPSKVWKKSSVFGLFVFLFLFVFKPFGLTTYPGNIFLISAGYGCICFTVMVVINIIPPSIFRTYFNEENWTAMKEFYFNGLNIILIAIANVSYSALIGIVPMNLHAFLVFLFYTIAIGIFPIGISILLIQRKRKRKFETQSLVLNEALSREQTKITISSNNLNEELTIPSNDLLFIQSADNYIEVNYLKNQLPAKAVIRNTLKQVEEDLQKHPQYYRCHKSFLVNLKRISSFSGNAQGYRLHFQDTALTVPVSRKLHKKVHQLLTIQP